MQMGMVGLGRGGVSIGMANASAAVQHAAKFVTTSNTDEGFALAMDRFVLGAPVVHSGWPRAWF